MLIVYNPAAGRRRAQLLWRVLDVIAANGGRVEVAETGGPGDAARLAAEGVAAGQHLIVAAGGDGTIAEVARGLNGSATRLGIIPLGTANVLAHELSLPFQPRDVAAALAFGRTRAIWPGQIWPGEPPGEMPKARTAGQARSGRLFVQMVGAGFDAEIVHRLDPGLKRRLGRSAYVLQALREAARYRFEPIRCRLDGVEAEAGSIIVTKGSLYGGRFELAPGVSPTERGFTVALFEQVGMLAALMYGAALPLGVIARMPGLRLVRAAEVGIWSAVPAQADGDPAGQAPMTLTDAPHPIDIVVR